MLLKSVFSNIELVSELRNACWFLELEGLEIGEGGIGGKREKDKSRG